MQDDPYTVRCGVEWYYPFDSGEPVVFESDHKYCLDCGEAIGVCSDDPDRGCVAHGLPPRGRKFTTTVAPETVPDESGEGEEEQQQPVEDTVDTIDIVVTPVPPEEDIVDETNVATTMAPPTGFEEEVVDENEPAAGEEESEIMPTQPSVEGVDPSTNPAEDSPSGAMYVGSALMGTVLVVASCLIL